MSEKWTCHDCNGFKWKNINIWLIMFNIQCLFWLVQLWLHLSQLIKSLLCKVPTLEGKPKLSCVICSFFNIFSTSYVLCWTITWIGEIPCLMSPIKCACITFKSCEPKNFNIWRQLYHTLFVFMFNNLVNQLI